MTKTKGKPVEHFCRQCKTGLWEKNWAPSRKAKQDYICAECHNECERKRHQYKVGKREVGDISIGELRRVSERVSTLCAEVVDELNSLFSAEKGKDE